MRALRTKNRFVIVFLFLSLGLWGSLLSAQPAKANGMDPEVECENSPGTWDANSQTCTLKESVWVRVNGQALWDMLTMILCGDNPTIALVYQWTGESWVLIECRQRGARPLESRCKLDEVDGSSAIGINHAIKATFRGPGNYLRLWSGEQYYRLPVITGTLQYLSDGLWTASFGTTDPLSGEALAPPGKYKVQCFGPSGTAGGTGTVTLTR